MYKLSPELPAKFGSRIRLVNDEIPNHSVTIYKGYPHKSEDLKKEAQQVCDKLNSPDEIILPPENISVGDGEFAPKFFFALGWATALLLAIITLNR